MWIAEIKHDRKGSIDFVIPGYRDFKIGKFVYSKESRIFEEQGIQKVYSEPGNKKHADYLGRMGFVPELSQDSDNLYSRSIN